MEDKKVNHLYYGSLRYGTYCGISFLTALAVIIPVTRFASSLIITGYSAYVGFSVFRAFAQAEKDGKHGKRALRQALSVDGIEIVYTVLALLVGLVVGFGG